MIDKNIAIFLFPSTTGSTTGRISGIRISECHFDELKGCSISIGHDETSPVDGRYIYACDFGISLVPGVNEGLDRTSTLIHVKSNDIRNVVGYAVFHLRHLDEDDRTNPSNLATQCFYKNNYVNGMRIADAESVDEFLIDRSGARG